MDLIFLKSYLNSSNFYFIIRLIGSCIERYLGGGAEFKSHISPITFGFGSLLSHSFTTTITLATPSTPSTTRNNPPGYPSPVLRGVGSINNAPGCAELTAALRPSPLQRDVGGLVLSQRNSRGWGTMEGGTREWEAHSVRHKNTSHDICRGSSPFPAHAILQITGVMNHDKDSATQPENQQRPANETKTQRPCGCGAATTSGTNGGRRPNDK